MSARVPKIMAKGILRWFSKIGNLVNLTFITILFLFPMVMTEVGISARPGVE